MNKRASGRKQPKEETGIRFSRSCVGLCVDHQSLEPVVEIIRLARDEGLPGIVRHSNKSIPGRVVSHVKQKFPDLLKDQVYDELEMKRVGRSIVRKFPKYFDSVVSEKYRTNYDSPHEQVAVRWKGQFVNPTGASLHFVELPQFAMVRGKEVSDENIWGDGSVIRANKVLMRGRTDDMDDLRKAIKIDPELSEAYGFQEVVREKEEREEEETELEKLLEGYNKQRREKR